MARDFAFDAEARSTSFSEQLAAARSVGSWRGDWQLCAIVYKQATSLTNVNYHIMDLSPALMANQRKILSEVLPESRHFHQNATEFDLPGHTFDLIVSNEVIADFPVAPVRRKPAGSGWQGDGAYYLDKYGLSDKDAPDSFLVNAGVFRFIERAWKHLAPGGTLIVSEYGSEQRISGRVVPLEPRRVYDSLRTRCPMRHAGGL